MTRFTKPGQYGIFIAFALICIVLALSTPKFFTVSNLLIIGNQVSINALLAFGVTFVIITGGIDLSLGSMVAVTGVVAATFAHPDTYPLVVPLLMGLAAGSAMGAFNGLVITKSKVPPFIVTLGTMTIGRGLALILSKGRPISNLSDEFYPMESDQDRLYFEFLSTKAEKTVRKAVVFTEFPYSKRTFNLALLDVLPDGETSDIAFSENNLDLEKVMATVAECIRLFFEKYPDAAIQIQGNTTAKSRLYRIIIARELSNIRKYYEIHGSNGVFAEPFVVNKIYSVYTLELKSL